MLHAIRTLWTLAIICAIASLTHLAFYGSEMGARLAVHDMLARNFKPSWDKWLDYSISTGDGQFDVVLRPLPGVSDDEAPDTWTSRVQEWWNSPSPRSDSLALSVKNGQIWIGPVQGAPYHRFGVGPHIDSMNLVYGAIVFAIIALLTSFILGRMVDSETKQKQYHRPGSILDRNPAAAAGGPGSSPGRRST